MVKIKSVDGRSRADLAGIRPDDILISINGHEIGDVLDYGFYLAEKEVNIITSRAGREYSFRIKKDTYDDIGLNFETALMDEKHRCENGCIFCFIDQNPKGMRPTIYFKDDDSRLSFIHGNYITLTNLKQHDIDRIIEMHISPINVSVHTTDPELRVKMMRNKRAGESLGYMKQLADGGCELHCQIVLCRGINDGDALIKTMNDLSLMYPAVTSVSVVPAGLTGHREGLYKLEPFTPDECRDVVRTVTDFGDKCEEKLGSRIFYASDEFYISGGIELPDAEFYGEFEQLDNGVGLIASFLSDIYAELEFIDDYDFDKSKARRVTIATGEAAFEYIKKAAGELERIFPKLSVNVRMIKNEFFGGEVTVAGLLTGVDIASQLKGEELGDELLIPASMLRAEGDLFLCGHTPEWLSDELSIPVRISGNDAQSFIASVLGCDIPK